MSGIYFFGCANHEAGHYLIDPQGTSIPYWRWGSVLPWESIDGELAPKGPRATWYDNDEIQGYAALHHKDGWTALAWWDRSVDKRGGSNAALFAWGTFTAEQMVEAGHGVFPAIFARFTYVITTECPRGAR